MKHFRFLKGYGFGSHLVHSMTYLYNGDISPDRVRFDEGQSLTATDTEMYSYLIDTGFLLFLFLFLIGIQPSVQE